MKPTITRGINTLSSPDLSITWHKKYKSHYFLILPKVCLVSVSKYQRSLNSTEIQIFFFLFFCYNDQLIRHLILAKPWKIINNEECIRNVNNLCITWYIKCYKNFIYWISEHSYPNNPQRSEFKISFPSFHAFNFENHIQEIIHECLIKNWQFVVCIISVPKHHLVALRWVGRFINWQVVHFLGV